MLHVALTGGIGSGKSTAARILVECGGALIDADALARAAVSPGNRALGQIAEEFGPGVLTGSGELDRGALAAIVFDDDAARQRLNAIVHPAVREAALERKREILANDPTAIIVEDIPLLAETGGAGRFHAVLVVHTPLPLRLERLEHRGMSGADARARLSAQATDAEREEIADVLLSNDGSRAQLRAQVDRAWSHRLEPYRDALVRGVPPAPGRADPPPGHLGRVLARVRTALPECDIPDPGDRTETPGSAGRSTLTVTGVSAAVAPRLHAAGFVPAPPPPPAARGRWFVSADPAARVFVQVR